MPSHTDKKTNPDNHTCSSCSSCGDSNTSGCSCPSKNSYGYTITFDNNDTHNCRLIQTIDINEQEYVILEHPETKHQLIYRQTKLEDSIKLEVVSDDELDFISKVYLASS